MKIKYLIFLINLLNAQDSLYWFDMSTVRDPVPIAPKILDVIYGKSQLNELDSLKKYQGNNYEMGFVFNYMSHHLLKK